jgi:uncharacterized HAD superfamily protein
MIVAFDIDGVVADFVSPFLRVLERRVGGGPIDPASITDPNFMRHPFLTREVVLQCMEEVSFDPAFWTALEPLLSPEQWRALERVSCEHDLCFITHRWVRDNYDIHQVTCDWLRGHGVSHPRVHFTQENKSEPVRRLNVAVFVDDRHENCEDVATRTDAVVFMPHRPYNCAFHHPRVQRIQELDEVFAYLAAK